MGVLGRHSFDYFLDHLGIEIDHLFTVINTGPAFGIEFPGFLIGDLHAQFSQYP